MGQYLGQRLEQVKIGNLYGPFHTDAEVRKDTTGKLAKENTDVLKRIEAVREAVQQKAPKNALEADNALQEVLQSEISKKNAGNLGAPHGAIYNFFHSVPKPNALLEKPQASNSGFTTGEATIFGTVPKNGIVSKDMTLVPDKNDPIAGQNPDTHKPDKNVKLASVNMDYLRSIGIDPKDAPKNYDVIVKHGNNTHRFAIGDNGPKDRKKVDFTPGAHLEMGTQSGDLVEYRVVPRGYKEG